MTSTINSTSLRVININEFLDMTLPPREYIIYPIFPKQGLIMIYANRGIGKTFVALHLACSIACAKNVFDDKWKIKKPYKVLYIDGEMPANTMQERLRYLIPDYETIQDYDNLKILTPDLQVDGIMPNLATIEGQSLVEEYVMNSDVIIIDNLSTLCRNGKENDSDSWIPVQEWLLYLRRIGKSLILIHHAGKNNQQRGTSKKEDILDTVIALKRPENYKSKEGAKFVVHYEKSRGFSGKDADPFEVTLEIDTNSIQQAIWGVKDIEDPEPKLISDLLNQGYTQREIGQKLNKSATTVNRMIKKIKEDEEILLVQ